MGSEWHIYFTLLLFPSSPRVSSAVQTYKFLSYSYFLTVEGADLQRWPIVKNHNNQSLVVEKAMEAYSQAENGKLAFSK